MAVSRQYWRLHRVGNGLKSTAKRVLNDSALVATSRPITSERCGNYDFAINNFIPTSGENKGKKLRRTKTRDHRIRISHVTP